ncbi:predicted protein [Histoplasma mississippiense (nom. inval.)]|uniref:predicted protein n=1 Tax=Ajellomyces capsulatus (strain NAm1 / WU24) TaxID=2059318 RepID=UPI000157B6EC|nr:predicted protein [Histoplasma mississippiense (nom. inval.)]EDN03641.1 predicted protein [Histoplasma mississippiense (nom. inval.)]
MSKTTKSNGIKAPPSSPLHPQTPPGSRSHANPPQPVTMEQLRELFMDVLRQAKQSSDSSKPIEDTKPETNKNKEGNEGKARASKLEYKEVHEMWDKDNSKYKIVDSVKEDKAIDDLDRYIFVVRNQLDRMTKETKAFVDIKSEALLDVLREIVRDVRAISLREDKPSIERNFLYNFIPDLEKYIIKKGWDHADPRSKHVDLLIGYIKETYASTTQSLSPLLKKGEITYDLLWTIFKPGIFVYSTCLGTGKPRCVIFDAGEEKTKMNGIKYFSLDCRYLDFDGEVFGEAGTQLEVTGFHGPRPIHTLEAFPLDHHPNKSGVMTSIIDFGRKFCSLKGQHIRHCRGRAFFKVRGEIVQICINSRVMVDSAFFRQMNPNYTRPRINQRNGSYVDNDGITHVNVSAFFDNQDQRMRDQVKSNGMNPSEMKDVDFLICCPTVLGFCFNENIWMEFAVADLDQVEWSSAPFENLKIPSQQRDTLLALARTRLGLVPSVPFDDFVTGKGRGLNVLLYGRPGLGKTFTAEALAEHLQRPLYKVPAGELIGDRCLEDHVSNIFKTASHFNAILLVDEADVFLHGRSVGGVHDHSVTVFLRKLEYFGGVLFLTTNRVDEFDDAILSRIHYKLKYEALGREFRRDVWRSFLSKSCTHQGSPQLSSDELHKLEGLDLSAREIRNLAMIAHALATVAQAAESNEEFARAFSRTERLETMYN